MTDDDTTEDGGISRRWLIRILVGLGIGIPILVEGATLLGLVGSRLSDDGQSTTTEEQATNVGDELLPETPQRETLTDAVVRTGSSNWTFEATVEVENAGDAPYTLRLGAVTTEDGTRVAGNATTSVEPGASETLTATWTLPSGESPLTMVVEGVVHRESGEETTRRVVRLGTVPLER